MVQQAVRAWQLIKAIKAEDIELLHGLPDWAVSAAMAHQVFMCEEDEFSGLWVIVPMETSEMYIEVIGAPEGYPVDAVAFRAHPNDILLYRGQGLISVLTDRVRMI